MADNTKLMRSWQDGATLVVGLWLIVSPWLLSFAATSAAMWNAVLFGAIIAVLALAALMRFRDWEEWVGMAVGVWLVVSPWVLGFAATRMAMWNAVIVGILTLALAGWALREHHDMHAA